jgi:hypothetical protein
MHHGLELRRFNIPARLLLITHLDHPGPTALLFSIPVRLPLDTHLNHP